MATPLSEQRGNAIILSGSFNPRILQPAWLAAQRLIRDAESENADIQIIHEGIVSFSLDWVNLEVDHDQLTVASTAKSETPEQVRDLALGVIEILDHTPIQSVGIQFFAHYVLADQAERDALGWTLVPPDPFAEQLFRPGMRTLQMSGRRAEGDEGGNGVLVTIEPSARITPNGVYLSVLDQYDVTQSSESHLGAGPAIDCIKNQWDSSFKRAGKIADDVFSVT